MTALSVFLASFFAALSASSFSGIYVIMIATLSSFDRYVSWLKKAQLQVRQLVSYFTINTVLVHVHVISMNSRTVTSLSH